MTKICIILGSGFSFHAGLPLAKEINSYFTRENKRNLLHFSSDEWKWYDLADAIDQHNGSISDDRLAYGYILDELVSDYVKITGKFESYEKFYQYVLDSLQLNRFLNKISSLAHEKFDQEEKHIKDSKFYDTYTFPLKSPQASQVYNLINHLIGDLLFWRKPLKEFSSFYDPFLSYIANFDNIDIFTLNHDLLLEALFEQHEIKYSDGFSIENSRLQKKDGKQIKCFNGIFNSMYNIVKLHGSLDLYKYFCAVENISLITPTGEYIYYKTLDYYEKQMPVRIDAKTGLIVQSFHSSITPQFITGNKKDELIENDEMYKALYKELKKKSILLMPYS